MGNEVYANGREISCKAADGKSIASFPDVCFTPPSTLATPTGVPIPYPNTGFATDATNGSKTVKITGKEVMLKNVSYFKKSTGDEPATRSLAQGVITHTITGKVYFNSWSMDVKVEGENVDRHMDLTTHNHMSVPGNTPTWPYMDAMAWSLDHPCIEDAKKESAACSKLEVRSSTGKTKVAATRRKQCARTKEAKACREAQKCMLRPMRPKRCCKGEQPHHLVEVHCFSPAGGRKAGELLPQFKDGYDEGKAPCVCATGARSDKEHGALHAVQQQLEAAHHAKNKKWSYKDACQTGVAAHSIVYPQCNPACIEAQLDAYHNQKAPDGPGAGDNTELRTDPQAGTRSRGDLDAAQQQEVRNRVQQIRGVGSVSSA
jgi:hypothetical protein